MKIEQKIALEAKMETEIKYPDPYKIIEESGVKEQDMEHQHRHWLVITNLEEDTGQDNYHEELEWEIEHSPECKYVALQYNEFDEGPWKQYECMVGQEILYNGVDGLEFVTGTGDGWRELEEGRYEIELWSSHDSFSGEWDGGLRFVDG